MTSLRQRFQARRTAWSIANLPEIGLLLVLGYALYHFATFVWQIVAYPYPVDYGEGPLLSQVGRLAAFENIYLADLTHAPYTITNYPPLYMLLQVPLNWLFGPAFWYGRLLSLLGMLLAVLFLGLTLYRLSRDRWAALVGAMLLFAIPYVKTWTPLFRIDPLALGLSWVGLYLVVRDSDERHSLLPAAIFLTAAIFTRQSYGLAAPLAAFAWLLSSQPRRRAFLLAAYVAGLSLGLFLLLNLLTGGGFFFNIVTANINAFQMLTLLHYVDQMLGDVPLLLAVGGLFLALGWIRNRAWALAGPYLLGAALSALTIGKIGSNVNYLLELSAALCLAMGLVVAWLRRRRTQAASLPTRTGWYLALLVLALLLAGQVYWAVNNEDGYDRYLLAKTALRTQNEVLLNLIEQAPGSVLTGEHMGLLALTGRPIYYQPFEMKQLSDSGVWNQMPFLDELASGQYPLILIYSPAYSNVKERRWTPEMLAMIQRHYRSVNNFEQTVVYQWKE